MESWIEARKEFLATEREHDKMRPIARGITLRIMDALHEAGCDLSVISLLSSHPYGTSINFGALDRREPPEVLNPKLEAQRAIVIAITRELGVEGKKGKEIYSSTGALSVEWATNVEPPKDPETGISNFADPEYKKARALAHAKSVRVSEYMPPTCRFVTKYRHIPACEAHDAPYTEIECGPDEKVEG